MASNYWIKLYHEILHDPKMGRLPDHLWRRFIELCLLAGEHDDDGTLPTVPDMAWTLRMNEEQLTADLHELQDAGFAHQDNGWWIVTNFAKRQAPVSSAERVSRYRDRKRKEQYYGNDGVTDGVTNRYTDTDTEVDTDTELDIDVPPDGATHPPDPRKEAQARFSILAQWFRLDLNLITESQRGRLNKLEKRVREYTVDDLDHAHQSWYKQDWRGKKGEPPANDGQLMQWLYHATEKRKEFAGVVQQ